MKNLLNVLMIAVIIGISFSFNNKKLVKNAKAKEFILCHKETTITKSTSYTTLNKLTDEQLKKACTSPENSDFVTVKKGTFNLRDGNTRIYLLIKRGFGDFSVPYDEVDTGDVCDF